MKREPRTKPSAPAVGTPPAIRIHDEARVRVGDLEENPFNPNRMPEDQLTKLRQSLRDHGLLENLVVRRLATGKYQILGGAHRSRVLVEALGTDALVPVRVVDPCDDAHAMIVNQILNRNHGEDIFADKAALYAELSKSYLPEDMALFMPDDLGTIRDLLEFDRKKVDALLKELDDEEDRVEDSRMVVITFGVLAREEGAILDRIRALCGHHDFDGANSRGKLLRFLLEQEWKRIGGA